MIRRFLSISRPALLGLGLLALVATGCKKKAAPATLPGDDVTLAKVGEGKITAYDVELAKKTSLGEAQARRLKSSVDKAVLDSLVQSRALAQLAEKEIEPLAKLELERKVAQHREQLLVMQYMAKHQPPEPVSDARVEQYYQTNLERFGQKTTRTYELIGSERELSSQERKELLEKLGKVSSASRLQPETSGAVDSSPKAQSPKPAASADWRQWTDDQKKQGLPVIYRSGETEDKLLHPKLHELLTTLKVKQASDVVFVQGRAYVVRITGENITPAKPLNQVKSEIARLLGPTQLSDAVKKAAAEALKTVKVEYTNAKPQGATTTASNGK